jgi:hypothetical protein
MRQPWRLLTLAALVIGALFAVTGGALSATTAITGSIFTTDSTCTGNNINLFSSKDAVYLDGGPTSPGGQGLPDGDYYVRILQTQQNTVVGTSLGSADPTPIHVTGGEFDQCYQLSAIVLKASDGTPGYDTSSNGEYKVEVSQNNSFPGADTKSDNFKVEENPPSAAAFRSGSAVRTGHGVLVRWRTASEVDTLGFNVYRQVNGKSLRVNKRIILAHGGTYSVVDRKATRSRNLRYRIQAVHTDGSRTWFGPLAVKARS